MTNFVGTMLLMLHTKFQGNPSAGSGEEVFNIYLAHLSRRLIGELILYRQASVVRPSVVNISNNNNIFSNDISSEAMKPILAIYYT